MVRHIDSTDLIISFLDYLQEKSARCTTNLQYPPAPGDREQSPTQTLGSQFIEQLPRNPSGKVLKRELRTKQETKAQKE